MPAVAVKEPYTLVLREDDDIQNPRAEMDNFGTMVCFHSRYNLGDTHEYGEPNDFLLDLVDSTVSDDDILAHVLADKAKSMRLQPNIEDDTWEVLIIYGGEDSWVAADSFDAVQGNEAEVAYSLIESMSDKDLLALAKEHCVILPLYLYDHSGLSMSTGSFIGRAHHAEWDSGQVGWIYAAKDTILAEYGGEALSPDLIEKAEALLNGEVSYYDAFLRGEAYGFQLYEHGEEVDSCWGFIGSPDELRADIEGYLPEECAGMMEDMDFNVTDTDIKDLLYEQEQSVNHALEGDYDMSNTEKAVTLDFTARAYPFSEPKGNTLGMASLTIGGGFAINNIRIMNSEKGPFVAMPSAKDKEGNFKDICFPTTKEGRAQMNQVIMDAYNEALLGKEQTAQRPSAAEKLNDAKKEAAKAPKEPKAAKGSKAKADPGIE